VRIGGFERNSRSEAACCSEHDRRKPDHVRVLAGYIAWPATGAALVAMAEREFGGLDILISNAGVFRQVTEENYDWFLDTGKFFIANQPQKQ
jgi:NAD(P)-dependent dehydrogenase (short-subunit alcohol dehydrogenase family)